MPSEQYCSQHAGPAKSGSWQWTENRETQRMPRLPRLEQGLTLELLEAGLGQPAQFLKTGMVH
jgi:hypothetical protein